MIQIVRADLGKSDPPEGDNDFGLFYPADYAFMTWQAWRQNGTLPESGALGDQDPKLVDHDWWILSSRYSFFYHQETGEYKPIGAARTAPGIEDL